MRQSLPYAPMAEAQDGRFSAPYKRKEDATIWCRPPSCDVFSYWMKSVSAAGIGFAIDAVLLK